MHMNNFFNFKAIVCIAASVLLYVPAQAKLSLRQPCSEGMVLQQRSDALVWGCATAGSTITVSADWGAKARTIADSLGFWQLYLPTPEAGYQHHKLTIKGDGETITLSNVLVGEVWFAGGQSNMEIHMSGYFDCPIQNASYYVANPVGADRVRMYMEPVRQAEEPNLIGTGRWLFATQNDTWDMSATAFFFARQLNASLDVPVGVVACPYGGSRVESWIPKDVLAQWGEEDLSAERIASMTDYHRPYMAHNAMFNPIAGYTVKGFIWYQGCSNVGAHQSFVPHMSWLINYWRSRCSKDGVGAELPFYMVEIAPYDYGAGEGISYASLLRDAQHKVAREVPNCGIVVTNDLVYPYEKTNIHPCRKKEIGDRLAGLALNRQYGFDRVHCNSPEAVEAFFVDGDKSRIAIRMTELPNGISRHEEVKALEVCDSCGVWHTETNAYARWEDGFLYVLCPDVPDPVAVRYGWGDFNPGNLYDGLGLPIAPFCLFIRQ